MSDHLEAAAKALWLTQFDYEKWKDAPEIVKDAFRNEAQEVVDAWVGDRTPLYGLVEERPTVHDHYIERQWNGETLGFFVEVVVSDDAEEEVCPNCDGLGWVGGIDRDPSDPTGQTPMQVQVPCPCGGVR